MLDFTLVTDYLPFLAKAAMLTFVLSVISLVIGLVLGLIIALFKISKFKVLNWFADIYLWVIRGTPLLVQLFLVYFGLPQLGIDIGPFPSAVLALAINTGAYVAEIYRGGIISIPKGQVEAAEALGMKYPKIMMKVVLPQAIRVSIPSLGNQAIILLKDSSLASLVTVAELMMVSQRYAATNYAYIEFYIVAAGFYLIMTTIFTVVLNKIEKRMSISEL